MDKKQLEALAMLLRHIQHEGATPKREWGRGTSMAIREMYVDHAKQFVLDLEDIGLVLTVAPKDQNFDP